MTDMGRGYEDRGYVELPEWGEEGTSYILYPCIPTDIHDLPVVTGSV